MSEQEQAVGRVDFYCDTPEQRQAIFDRIDKLLDELPNNFHLFAEMKGTMKTPEGKEP